MRVSYKVSFIIPDGAGLGDCKQYIRDAVEGWAGSLCPGLHGHIADPMFYLNRKTVGVKRICPTVKRKKKKQERQRS